jgi:hypothetical protein
MCAAPSDLDALTDSTAESEWLEELQRHGEWRVTPVRHARSPLEALLAALAGHMPHTSPSTLLRSRDVLPHACTLLRTSPPTEGPSPTHVAQAASAAVPSGGTCMPTCQSASEQQCPVGAAQDVAHQRSDVGAIPCVFATPTPTTPFHSQQVEDNAGGWGKPPVADSSVAVRTDANPDERPVVGVYVQALHRHARMHCSGCIWGTEGGVPLTQLTPEGGRPQEDMHEEEPACLGCFQHVRTLLASEF